MSVYTKGVSLGITKPKPELVRERGERLAEGERLHVDLLGRAVPVVRTLAGLRALDKDKLAGSAQIERYVAGKLNDRLEEVRKVMRELAGAFAPEGLHRRGFYLYGKFRPRVPTGERRWGAQGELDLDAIRAVRTSA
jgi:hypothetical protein